MLEIFKSISWRIKYRIYFLEGINFFLLGLFFGFIYHLLKSNQIALELFNIITQFNGELVSIFNIISSWGDGWVLVGFLISLYFIFHNKSRRGILYFSALLMGFMFWNFIFLKNNLFIGSGIFSWFDNKNQIGSIFTLTTSLHIFINILLIDITIYVFKKTLTKIKVIFSKIFFENLKKILLNYLAAIYDKFNVLPNGNLPVTDSPLKDMVEIEEVRKLTGDRNLFVNFESNIHSIHQEISIYHDKGKRESSSVICVNGKWGSGKTSITQIVKSRLLPKNRGFSLESGITWLTFKPWGFSNSDELIESFFGEIKTILRVNYGINLGNDLNRYVRTITPMLEGNGVIKSFLKNFEFIDLFSTTKTHRKLRESMGKRIKNIPGTVVIFIDDLDRLAYKDIMLILKLVKENMDFPGLMFLLPFDYKRVSELIVEERGGAKYYYGYLQKIIKSKVTVSPLTYGEMQGIFENAVSKEFKAGKLRKPLTKEEVLQVYEQYVLEYSSQRFRTILMGDDGNKTLETKPSFHFYAKLFKYFKSELTGNYSARYKIIISDSSGEGLRLALSTHVSGEIYKLHNLIEYLYRPIKKIARIDLLGISKRELEASIRKPGVSWVAEFLDGLDPIFTNYSTMGIRRLELLKKHIDDFWNNNPTLSTSNEALFQEVSKSLSDLITRISNYIDRFEPDWKNMNQKDMSFMRDWISTGMTPRDVKLFASALFMDPDCNWGEARESREFVRNYLSDKMS